MTDREEHMRRMLEHSQKTQQKEAEFELQCRQFWKFIQSAYVKDQTKDGGPSTRAVRPAFKASTR